MAETDWESLYASADVTTPIDGDVAALAAALVPGTALDLGCGAGQNALWLARQGWRVTGIDIAPTAIRSARSEAALLNIEVEFLVADLTSWQPERAYDLVISTYALPPEGPGRTRALALAVDAVRPHGSLLIAEFDVSMADSGSWKAHDLLSLDQVLPLLDGWTVSAAGVVERMHAHGDEQERYPIVLVAARRTGERDHGKTQTSSAADN